MNEPALPSPPGTTPEPTSSPSSPSSLRTDPARSARLLRQTTEGCDHLADSWESLAQTLPNPKLPDPRPVPPRPLPARLLHPLLPLARHRPRPLRPVLLLPPHPVRRQGTTSPASSHTNQPPFPPDDALTTLLDFIDTETTTPRNPQAAYLWETQDRPSRQSAPARAAFEGTPETARFERYLASAPLTGAPPPPGPRRTPQNPPAILRTKRTQARPNPQFLHGFRREDRTGSPHQDATGRTRAPTRPEATGPGNRTALRSPDRVRNHERSEGATGPKSSSMKQTRFQHREPPQSPRSRSSWAGL